MKAAVYHKYGPPEVVSLEDIPRPKIKETEVLIQVHASTVSSGDWRLRSLELPAGMGLIGRLAFGIRGPRKKVLGTDLAGVIVEKGAQVSGWEIGDAVVGFPNTRMGAHAEYAAMPADGILAHKPENLSFAEAAAIPFGGLTALDFLCGKAKLKAGERVLIVGASGATGSAAVQLASHFGAHVTGVCSGANAELVRQLGAERVIDYRQEDFSKDSTRYDMIVDTTATAPWKRIRHMLSPKGRFVVISGGLGDMLRPIWNRRMIGGVSNGSIEGLQTLLGLAEEGAFFPLIDRIYPFEHIVNAHTHVDSGRKKGAVVLSIIPEVKESQPLKEPFQ